jgi:uncharacterized protein YkwD
MMHRSAWLAVSGAVVAVLVAAGWALSSQPANALTNCDTTEAGIVYPEQQMLDLINGARASAGLQPLKLSPSLNRASAWKSADSSASGAGFSHTDSLGRSPFQRSIDCGYPPPGAAENIAYGSSDPGTIFNLWMQSSGHRQNILTAGYRVIGIGLHGNAWTTDFGFTDDSGVTAPPPVATTPPPTAAASTTAFPTAATAQPTATPSPTASPTPQATSQPVSKPNPLGFRWIR